jgi:multidrug efflux pump
MRRSLGTAVFSGMIGVTVFGLIFTPVFYVAIRWLTGNRKRAEIEDDDPLPEPPSANGHAHGPVPQPAAAAS